MNCYLKKISYHNMTWHDSTNKKGLFSLQKKKVTVFSGYSPLPILQTPDLVAGNFQYLLYGNITDSITHTLIEGKMISLLFLFLLVWL